MTTKFLATMLLLFALPLAAAAGGEADAILGVWITENGDAAVKIAKTDGKYHGEIVWLEEPNFTAEDDKPHKLGQPKTDDDNPDEKLRDRPILGLKIVHGFEYKGEGKWEGGRIYDPENGKTYKCKMKLESEDLLKVRGYIGFSLLGRTTEWRRPQLDVDELGAGDATPVESP